MITNYTQLQASVIDWSFRTDMASRLPEFIQLCESDMQVRCKLVDFEASATITVTAGLGTLPSGFTGMRAIYWDGDTTRPLKYVTPDQFDKLSNYSGQGYWYTITGTSLKVAPMTDGTAVMTYKARFDALSVTNATNVILDLYPDAYLHGTLLQLAVFTRDEKLAQKEGALFEACIERIRTDNNQRKYAGATLQVTVS
jgi:hypothetical protein